MKIAVSIPTMNRPGMLREAIRSVLNQSRPADEIFVSDNSKVPDETLLKDFPGAPIRYHFHDHPLSIEEHWTWALSQPRADYVCWLEDDNLFRSNHLEVLASGARQFPNASLYGTAAVVFHKQNSRLQRSVMAPQLTADLLSQEPVVLSMPHGLTLFLFGTAFAASCVMINKAVWDREPMAACGCRQPLDLWLWAQMASRGDTVYLPHLTMLYREHGSQHSASSKRELHRSEARKVKWLIHERMRSLGIDPARTIPEMLTRCEPGTAERFAYIVARTRDLELTRLLLPSLLGTPAGKIPTAKYLELLWRFKVLPKFGVRPVW